MEVAALRVFVRAEVVHNVGLRTLRQGRPLDVHVDDLAALQTGQPDSLGGLWRAVGRLDGHLRVERVVVALNVAQVLRVQRDACLDAREHG